MMSMTVKEFFAKPELYDEGVLYAPIDIEDENLIKRMGFENDKEAYLILGAYYSIPQFRMEDCVIVLVDGGGFQNEVPSEMYGGLMGIDCANEINQWFYKQIEEAFK